MIVLVHKNKKSAENSALFYENIIS